MKPVMYSLLIFSLIAIIVFGCEKNNENNPENISGKLVDNSECKFDLKASSEAMVTPDSLSCMEYSFDKENSKLTMKHINAGFNCCPGNLSCDVSLKGDTIVMKESEESFLCDCNCLYDLDIEVDGVAEKAYWIKVDEPYAGDQEKLVFEVNLAQHATGSYCVTRKMYPWGMNLID
jgi:hypothetical protein